MEQQKKGSETGFIGYISNQLEVCLIVAKGQSGQIGFLYRTQKAYPNDQLRELLELNAVFSQDARGSREVAFTYNLVFLNASYFVSS